MEPGGWIKLYRKLLESPVFDSEKGLKIWVWCLLKANHRDKVIFIGRQRLLVKKGSFIMGGHNAQEILKIARSTIFHWLHILEREGMVSIKKTNKYTVVTIPKWNDYQDDWQQMDINSTTNETQKITNKNDKNVENDKKNTENVLFEEFWKIYPRKEAKAKAKVAFERKVHTFEQLKVVMSFIMHAVKSDRWQEDGGRFIPHATTFINQERWNDDKSMYAISSDDAPVTVLGLKNNQ